MKLFIWEFKKLLLKRRGLLLIALFFLLRLGSLLLLDTPDNGELELYREDYMYYLSQTEGSLTAKSAALLDGIFQKIIEAGIEIPRLYNSFYDGNITKEELSTQVAPYEEALIRKNGFQLLYEQFIYAREDPEHRYLLYNNGWNALLTDNTLDMVFVSMLLLIITPIFCHEYHSDMDMLDLTTRRGTKRLTLTKLLLAAYVVTFLCLLHSTLEYVFYGLRYGLPHGNYPLQSLPYFADSTKSLTLMEAFLWTAVNQWFGSLLFGVVILFLSVLTRKYTLTLIVSTSFLILPYYIVQNETLQYFLPGPLAFLLATGFLRGTEIASNPFTQQDEVLFHEITGSVFLILIGVALLLLAVMLYVIFRKTSTTWSRGWNRGSKCRKGAVLLFLLLLGNITGCTDSDSSGTGYGIYNAVHRSQFENENYIIWFDEETETLLFQNKETGRREQLVRDPLQLSSTIGRCIYGNGRYVYYFRNDYNKSGRYEGIERISLIEVDMETFQERIVYENARSSLDQVFFGNGINSLFDTTTRHGTRPFLEDVWAFFISGNTLYLLGNNIRTIDLLSGRMDTLDGPCPAKGSLAFDGRMLYYTTDQLQVETYDTKTGEVKIIPGLITEFFFLTDTLFIYINRADEYRLYAMERKDGTTIPLTNRPVLQFDVANDSICYTDRSDRKVYHIDKDGQCEPVEKSGT